MLKKTITYTDFDGNDRTEDFYFNLTTAELMDLELSRPGGFSEYITAIINAKDITTLISEFRNLIDISYGVKSPDGKRFIKTTEVLEEFKQTQAYSDFYMTLATDSKAGSEFINGIMPKDLLDKAKTAQANGDSRVKFTEISK